MKNYFDKSLTCHFLKRNPQAGRFYEQVSSVDYFVLYMSDGITCVHIVAGEHGFAHAGFFLYFSWDRIVVNSCSYPVMWIKNGLPEGIFLSISRHKMCIRSDKYWLHLPNLWQSGILGKVIVFFHQSVVFINICLLINQGFWKSETLKDLPVDLVACLTSAKHST